MEIDGSKVWLTIKEQKITELTSPRDVDNTNVRPFIDARKLRQGELQEVLSLDDDHVGPIERHSARNEIAQVFSELAILKEMDVQLNPDQGTIDELLRKPEV